jgi:hypothetical protein
MGIAKGSQKTYIKGSTKRKAGEVMTRIKIEPLRDLIEEEKSWLEKISRSQSEPAGHVTRAKRILGVSQGKTYTEAAHQSVANRVIPYHIW